MAVGQRLKLAAAAARHVQVLRLRPGAALTLFDGRGAEWPARLLALDRSAVEVLVLGQESIERELTRPVTLAPGMPANDRMDALIEKATELGAAAIVPLECERSVLRLAGERAERRAAHWRAVAIAACEQCGRNLVPAIATPQTLSKALGERPAAAMALQLSLAPDAMPAAEVLAGLDPRRALWIFSGPEGGFTPAEQTALAAAGAVAVSLGSRVLRADTAPLAMLALLALGDAPPGVRR